MNIDDTDNEANRLRLKSRPGIILEFDPPRWDYEEVTDTIGRVYIENGQTVYKLPGDLPEDADLETVEPMAINPDGMVQQWFYTRTSDPEAETTENHNRKLGEEREAEGFYARPRRAASTTPVPVIPKPGRFDRELTRLWKSILFSTKFMAVLSIVLLIGWGISWGISRLNNSADTAPKQVTVKLTVLPEVNFQYILPATQVAQQLKPVSLPLTIEVTGEATGTVQVSDGVARGSVRFANAGTASATLPVGTVIVSVNGINYKLVQAVTVPGANFQLGNAGFADTQIQADQAGPAGNLPGGIGAFAFRGTVSVAGLGAVSGGTNRTVKVATVKDINRLKTRLHEQANQEATTSFDQKLTSNQKRWGAVELGEPEFAIPEPGSEQPSGQFKGNITLQLTATCYRPDELLKLVATPPAAPGLPLEYSAARFQVLNKDVQGKFNLNYTRTLQMISHIEPLLHWQGSRAEFEEYVTELKSKPGLRFIRISGDLPQDWQWQVQATFEFN